MRRRSRNKIRSEVNLTPLIDVMTSLLAIFMITAPLLTSGIPLNLPKGALLPESPLHPFIGSLPCPLLPTLGSSSASLMSCRAIAPVHPAVLSLPLQNQKGR